MVTMEFWDPTCQIFAQESKLTNKKQQLHDKAILQFMCLLIIINDMVIMNNNQ